MSSLFQGVASVEEKVLTDKVGYIKALLEDIEVDPSYEDWMALISLLKYEIEDEDEAFTLFDEFSSKFDSYNETEAFKKFYESDFQGEGEVTLGTLVYIAKRDIPNYNRTKYEKFFGTEKITKLEKFNRKVNRLKDKMPDHILYEGIQELKFPDTRIDPVLALSIIFDEGKEYGTGTSPWNIKIVNPYKGDRLEQYITVNPIEDIREEIDPDNPYKGIRTQEAVTNYKYAVLEFDSISLDEQYSIISSVDLPYEAIVFTGNKSIHSWIRIDAPDLEAYKKRTRLINKMFEDFGYTKKLGKGIDTAVLYDCSSLVRCPGVTRLAWDKTKTAGEGNEQRVIWAEESNGWEYWYNNTYPNYISEQSLNGMEEEFVVPEKCHNFNRKKRRVVELLKDEYEEGESFHTELKQILSNCNAEEIEPTINLIIPEFFNNIVKKSRGRLVPKVADLYHMLVDSVLEAGHLYEGDLREVLYRACGTYENYEAKRKEEQKVKLESTIDSVIGQINEYVDPVLIFEIEQALDTAANSEKAEDFPRLVRSVERMFHDLDHRPAVLVRPELHTYAKFIGNMLSGEIYKGHHLKSGILYNYYNSVHFLNKDKHLEKLSTATFPSFINPHVGFVRRSQKGEFNVGQLDNDSVTKLMASPMFSSELRTVELISDVPIFKELDGSADLIFGYDDDKKALITGDCNGYGFMDLEEAKEIILDLFSDFEFLDASDLSRAVGALLMPAMCHADLLRGDFRPICYIDADQPGAGKGTLANVLTLPYADNPPLVTQDDTSVGSIDDKVGNAIMSGENLIIIDNLKPTFKMKELSSSFLEGLSTSDEIGFRSAMQKAATLNAKSVCLYLTTNGMTLSKDLAERSLPISIRKKAYGTIRTYKQGHSNYLKENRHRIMSAIYTILREYVKLGKPQSEPLEPHRFLQTVPVLNFIVKEIFDLEDITTGTAERKIQRSAKDMDVLRSMCFAIDKSGSLDDDLNNLDIFEILYAQGCDEVLGLGRDLDLYSDEDNTNLTVEAKRKIGQRISRIMSAPHFLGRANRRESTSCEVEEYRVTRYYDTDSKSAKYLFERTKK